MADGVFGPPATDGCINSGVDVGFLVDRVDISVPTSLTLSDGDVDGIELEVENGEFD